MIAMGSACFGPRFKPVSSTAEADRHGPDLGAIDLERLFDGRSHVAAVPELDRLGQYLFIGGLEAIGIESPHQMLCHGTRARRPGCEAPGQGQGLAIKRVVGNDPVDDVPALERGGVKYVGRIDDLAGSCVAAPAGQALCSAEEGGGADNRLRLRKTRRFAGEDQVACQRQLEPRREAEPLDRRDHWKGQILQSVADGEIAPQDAFAVFGAAVVKNFKLGAAGKVRTLRAKKQRAVFRSRGFADSR